MKLKTIFSLILFTAFSFSVAALPFNSNLSQTDKDKLLKGEVLIKNIDYSKYMCLDGTATSVTEQIVNNVKGFNPKYLAEIIQIRDYKGNENFPEKLEAILNNIPEYAGIPYWSERNQRYYDLYSSAKIAGKTTNGNKTNIKAELYMKPFGDLFEEIEVERYKDGLLYSAYNTNELKYEGISCVGAKKFKTYIYLFKYEDKWILYGIGGVNAPHIPFMTDRIRTSFINRVKTFCNFAFKKL